MMLRAIFFGIFITGGFFMSGCSNESDEQVEFVKQVNEELSDPNFISDSPIAEFNHR